MKRGPFGPAGMGQVWEILPLQDPDVFQPSNSLVSERATPFRGDGSDRGQKATKNCLSMVEPQEKCADAAQRNSECEKPACLW
jgi:hypothetical protein